MPPVKKKNKKDPYGKKNKSKEQEIQIEVTNLRKYDNYVDSRNDFVGTVINAFDRHYPLSLRADDIWILLAYGFSRYMDEHAEEVREHFVSHEGKKILKVQVDHFTVGGMSPEDWERDVFPDFSRQIRENVGEETHDLLSQGFSTTTVGDKSAFEITLMSIMKHYFSYQMYTFCGIPWIELCGTEQDWIDLRNRSEQLFGKFMPSYSQLLLPVLDKFVDAYRGNVDHLFWQGMCKIFNTEPGSGERISVSGWISLFYPYLKERENRYLKRWEELLDYYGPDPVDFPTVMSSAPVIWDYLGTELKLHFHAGFFGTVQDKETLALSPCVGWIVTHDPPETKEE